MRISDWSSDVCSSDLIVDGIESAAVKDKKGARRLGAGHRAGLTRCPQPPLHQRPRLRVGDHQQQAFEYLPGVSGRAALGDAVDAPGLGDEAFPVRRGVALQHALEHRSEAHTSELQSLMRTSYAVFCL